MNYSMNAVDEVRRRAKVGYELAKEALDVSEGDVLGALIYLEKRTSEGKCPVKSFVGKFKELVNEGMISQIRILKNSQVIFDLPVVAGVAVAALWTLPFTVALGAAIASKCEIQIVRRDGVEFRLPEVTKETLSSFLDSMKFEFHKVKDKMSSHGDSCHCDSDFDEDEDFCCFDDEDDDE